MDAGACIEWKRDPHQESDACGKIYFWNFPVCSILPKPSPAWTMWHRWRDFEASYDSGSGTKKYGLHGL